MSDPNNETIIENLERLMGEVNGLVDDHAAVVRVRNALQVIINRHSEPCVPPTEPEVPESLESIKAIKLHVVCGDPLIGEAFIRQIETVCSTFELECTWDTNAVKLEDATYGFLLDKHQPSVTITESDR